MNVVDIIRSIIFIAVAWFMAGWFYVSVLEHELDDFIGGSIVFFLIVSFIFIAWYGLHAMAFI